MRATLEADFRLVMLGSQSLPALLFLLGASMQLQSRLSLALSRALVVKVVGYLLEDALPRAIVGVNIVVVFAAAAVVVVAAVARDQAESVCLVVALFEPKP